MKRFIYAEACEGGMEIIDATEKTLAKELGRLYGWMDKDCRKQDQKLLEWAATAEVGDMRHHRLGILIRIKDKRKKKTTGAGNPAVLPTVNERAQKAFSRELARRWKALKAGKRSRLFDGIVEVIHQDGSRIKLTHASGKEDGKYLYVFSEHNGALGFHIEDLEGWTRKEMFS